MNLLFEALLAWLCALFCVCSVLQCWFRSSLPCELLITLKQLGWRKRVEGFWPDEDPTTMTRDEWMVWANACVLDDTLPRRLIHICGCPTCFSVHASYIAAALILLVWFPQMHLRAVVEFFLACAVTIPWLSNRLVKL